VTALGRLEPEGEVLRIGAPPGDRFEEIRVREGDWISPGEILAILESHSVRRAERDLISSRLEEAKSRQAAEETHAEAVVREALVRLQQVEEILPLEIPVLEAEVRGLETELEMGQRDLSRLQNLTGKESAPQQELDHQIRIVEGTRARLDSVRARLSKLSRSLDVEQRMAATQLTTSRAALARIQASSPLKSLGEQLKLANEQLQTSVLKSPTEGRILRILGHAGENTGSQPVLLLGNTKTMYAVAEVYETDVELVREGQAVQVTSPVLSQPLKGTVTQIAPFVSRNEILDIDPASDADRRVVRVRVRLQENDTAQSLVHLQVKVSIQVD
jgi:HlyD family secretion protein